MRSTNPSSFAANSVSKFCRWSAAIAFALALVLSPLSTGALMAETKTVTAENGNEQVQLSKGDTLVVRLDYQGGTGYTWSLSRYNGTVLRTDGKSAREQPNQMPGAKGIQVFRFDAAATGTSTVDFTYARPFDKGEPARTFRLTVQVR
jgi:predicted secreted protein